MQLDPRVFGDLVDRALADAPDWPTTPTSPVETMLTLNGCFSSSMTVVSTALYRLVTQLQFEFEAFGRATRDHLAVAQALRANLGGDTTGSAEAGDRVDEAIATVLAKNGRKSLETGSLGLHPSQRLLIDSVLRLRRAGFDFTMVAGVPNADDSVMKDAVAHVDAQIAARGGMGLLTRHFESLSPKWDQSIGRFLLGQRYGSLSEPARQALPHGLLLHFYFRHLWDEAEDHTSPDPRQAIAMIADLAMLREAAWATPTQGMFVPPESLRDFVVESTLFDRLYGLEQMAPDHAMRIIFGLWSDPKLVALTNSNPEAKALLAVAGAICRRFARLPFPSWVRRRGLLKDLPKSLRVTGDLVLTNYLVANKTSARPPSDPFGDWADVGPPRPLVDVDGEALWHPPPSVASLRLIESVHYRLCKLLPQWPKQEGLALERHLIAALRGRGVNVATGSYSRHGKEEGEVDLAICTEKAIIFFEVKRRVLTLPAKLGAVGPAFRDLTEPVVTAQLQLLRHELRLRKDGELRLIDRDGGETKIRREGRAVERFSVSMFDYGGLQVRESARHLLRAAIRLRFQSTDPKLSGAMQKLTEALTALVELVSDLETHGDPQSDSTFMNVGFVSIPYLYTLMDESSDTASFVDQLMLGARVTASTRSPYDELAFTRALRATKT